MNRSGILLDLNGDDAVLLSFILGKPGNFRKQ